MKIISRSLSETQDFAKKYVGGLIEARVKAISKSKKALIVGLYGDLGSGKTAFTQAIAAELGIKEQITSPTYVIEKIYPLSHSFSTLDSQSFNHLIHIDAYRLESASEMKHLGWEKIAQNPHNLIVIEWPERISELLPTDHVSLKFTFINETTREIEVVQ